MSSWTAGYVTDLEYTHGFYRELTPALIAFAALAAGHRPPNVNAPLTYCELGAGQGFSTNLLAAANPHIEFYANDFNPGQVAGAERLAAEAGSTNVHFSEESFEERVNNDSLPDFDIISLHGIYSWVNVENRGHIVEFIRRRLKPGGMVYVSYNSLPGWSAAAPLRHLMYLHGKQRGGPTATRLEPALVFMEKLIGTNANYFRANTLLKERFDKLKSQNRNYLAHEYLNDAWTLLYHSDVAAEMEAAKLSFIGSSHLLDFIDPINLSAEQTQMLAGIPDPTFKQTVRDYMVNQQFRRDIFVKGPQTLTPGEVQAHWNDMRFALSTHRPSVPMKVMGNLGEAGLQEETYTPLLDALADGPRTVRQLVANPTIAAIGWTKLQQGLMVLVGMGHLQPCLDAKGDAKRAQRTKAFNSAILNRSRMSGDLVNLASPVTGGAVGLDRVSQLLYLGSLQKAPDPAKFAWDILLAQGQRMMKEGKAIETEEENLAMLRERYQEFTEKHLPVLQQLGIA